MAARPRISTLLTRQLQAGPGQSDPAAMQELCDMAARGQSEDILLAIKEPMKHGVLAHQLKAFDILDELVRNSTPNFTIALSSEEWTERFFRLAKTTEHTELRDTIIAKTIGWTRLYGTSGLRSLLGRFSNSKVLGDVFRIVFADEERKERERRAQQAQIQQQQQYANYASPRTAQQQAPAAQRSSFADPSRGLTHQSPTVPSQQPSMAAAPPAQQAQQQPQRSRASRDISNIETFLMEAQADLCSLEFGLERPDTLTANTVRDCETHKMRAATYLQNPQLPADARDTLMLVLEQLTHLLTIYRAINGDDSAPAATSSSAAPSPTASVTTRSAAPATPQPTAESDDEEDGAHVSPQLRRVMSGNQQPYDPRDDTISALRASEDDLKRRLEQERGENAALRKSVEEHTQASEEVQKKYKHAKEMNKKACDAYEEALAKNDALTARIAQLEAALNAKSSEPPPQPKTVTVVQTIKPKVSGAVLRRIEESFTVLKRAARDVKASVVTLRKESEDVAAQAKSAVSKLTAAAEMERAGDVRAFQRMQDLYKNEMKLRKQYYNAIQELKGNIRVYCRVRPISSTEVAGGHSDVTSFPTEDEIRVVDGTGKAKNFEFDSVFRPDSTQERVFEDTCPLIDSVIDGYNVCIFAYGQTGSGKTHTMTGSESDRGINRRALDRLFECIREREANEIASVTVSVLEIYNDSIRDLLVPKAEAARQSYEVRQGGPYGQYVTNLTETTVQSVTDVQEMLNRSAANRSEGATNMNLHSSRSHMVLYIIVKTENKHTGVKSFGKLSLVDLAGSERLDKSGAEGQAAKEAVAINKSLTALGGVISGLSQGAKHVPFRDSTLTYLLQDSMAGQAKVLMFCCVSPASYNATESLSSLNFAARARGVALGPVKKNAAA